LCITAKLIVEWQKWVDRFDFVSGPPRSFVRTALAERPLETIHFGPEYCERALSLRRAANGEIEMNAQATKLQAAENDLKRLMADVTQAIEKAQQAVSRIAPKAAAAATETESSSR
jgi:hypothetical protein